MQAERTSVPLSKDHLDQETSSTDAELNYDLGEVEMNNLQPLATNTRSESEKKEVQEETYQVHMLKI